MNAQVNQYFHDLFTFVAIIVLFVGFVLINLFVQEFYTDPSKQITLEGKFLISKNMLNNQIVPKVLAAHISNKR